MRFLLKFQASSAVRRWGCFWCPIAGAPNPVWFLSGSCPCSIHRLHHPAHCMFLPGFPAATARLWKVEPGQRTVSRKQCNMSLLPVPGNSVEDIVVAGLWFIGQEHRWMRRRSGMDRGRWWCRCVGDSPAPFPGHTLLIADCGSWKFGSVSGTHIAHTSTHRTHSVHSYFSGRLTCMRSLVGLQVRTLRVDFFAAEKLALVYPPLGVRAVIAVMLARVVRFRGACGSQKSKDEALNWVKY